jgi:hypothetical protein
MKEREARDVGAVSRESEGGGGLSERTWGVVKGGVFLKAGVVRIFHVCGERGKPSQAKPRAQREKPTGERERD